MFKNNLKIAVRNLRKYKFYSFINITGLAIGIATCLLIMLFVQNELNYDRFNKKADRIFRVIADLKIGGNSLVTTTLGAPAAEVLHKDYPEVENAVRIQKAGSWFIRYGERSFKETKVIRADSTFFDIFTVPLLRGNPKTALRRPNTLVLSEKMADKYFGKENPIGKTLRLNNSKDYTVTGVFTNIPSNSHFHADFILPLQIKHGGRNDYWLGNMDYVTYILLQNNSNYKSLEAKFPAMVQEYISPEIEQFAGKSLEDFIAAGNKAGFYLQPLTDIHLHSHLMNELEPNGDIKYVIIFSAIAVFILLIACINFMNLSTASSSKRAKEVGIKKVLGSERKDLIKQFLTESVMMSLLATIMALVIIPLVIPFFNNLSGKELSISYFTDYRFSAGILILTIFIGVLAGSYPALFISSFKPASVLKGKLRAGSESGLLRGSMVVFQFTASIIMITATVVVFNQLNYIQNKKLGFNKEHAIVIHGTFILGDQVQTFKNEITSDSRIESGTAANALPIESKGSSIGTFRDRRKNDEKLTAMQSWNVDYDYVPTLGMKIIKGRNFSRDFGSDSSAVIINEAVVKHFEWNDPIGKRLGQYGSSDGSKINTYHVIGVVKNFNYESLKNTIGPVILFLRPGTSYTVFRFRGDNVASVINFIRRKWEKFVPGQAFGYSFLDEDFNNMYQAEQKIGHIFSVFAFLAIFIGCLGLFGLAAFTAEQKTKEIGVRKVLGASVPGIVFLLSKEFIRLISIAMLISVPVAYYFMNKWLQNFAYRIEISWWIFGLAGGLALIIALLTVSWQAIRAATANPVESLRYE